MKFLRLNRCGAADALDVFISCSLFDEHAVNSGKEGEIHIPLTAIADDWVKFDVSIGLV